ncbi:MAG: nitroreductase [Paenibacillaceae bacterium]|jgi:nitroreductase|nr:nitroreductase [Paenibacillaceae bacterium]
MTTSSSQTSGSETIQTLLSRHSVRRYKKGVRIQEDILREILEVAGRAPSAWNLQHWKFLVIQEQDVKEKLLPIAYNQPAIVDSSAVVVVLGDYQANKNAEAVFSQSIAAGVMLPAYAERSIVSINQAYEAAGAEFARQHAYLNAGLVSMQLMIAAKALGYDTVPMTGFNAQLLSEQFQIEPRYVPAMIVCIGVSDEPSHQSPRLPLEQVIYQNL